MTAITARIGSPVLAACLMAASCPALADDVFHDFQLGQKIASECFATAVLMQEAVACVGEAMRQCLDPQNTRPWKVPRDCNWHGYTVGWGEARIWEDIYQSEVMKKLQWARTFDEWYFSGDGVTDALYTVMEAEGAWRGFAYSFCGLVSLPDAEKPYEYRLSHDPQCMAEMFAERAFHLRSLSEMEP
jgi:hypothetical protein